MILSGYNISLDKLHSLDDRLFSELSEY